MANCYQAWTSEVLKKNNFRFLYNLKKRNYFLLYQNWIVLEKCKPRPFKNLDALHDWNLDDQVQIMCCDTTASNTGRLSGACVLLEQRLERQLLLFACRHIYELLLKSVFEAKIQQVTNNPDIPLFKRFRDNWSNIDSTNIQIYLDFVNQHYNDCEIYQLVL